MDNFDTFFSSGVSRAYLPKWPCSDGVVMRFYLAATLAMASISCALAQPVGTPVFSSIQTNSLTIPTIPPGNYLLTGPGGAVSGATIPAQSTGTFTTHAALIGGATGFIANTLYQAGFSTQGDGGAATYNWNASSFCPGGTMGSPTTADGIVCILPTGQSASTAGRYLLQVGPGGLDVRTVGILSGGQDNSPLTSSLMTAIGPPNDGFPGGSDVVWLGTAGQNFTAYYYTKSLVLSRKGRYHCSGGPGGFLSTELVFAAGVDGIIQESSLYSSDGSSGGGVLDGCAVYNMGFGSALATQGSNSITAVGMFQEPSHTIPVSTWNVGDGIIMIPQLGAFYPWTAVPSVQPGAFVSAVAGSTLTLGGSYTASQQLIGFATVSFLETGSNNFVAGDTVQVGNNTFTAAAAGTAAGTFQIGANFAAAASNLVSAINTNASGATWGAPLSTPNISAQTFSTLTTNQIIFTDLTTGTGGNSFASVYTAVGTAAGTFPQGTFKGGSSATSNNMRIIQLPVALSFSITTTLSSNSVNVTGGPRLLVPGDWVWSDAFPLGTQVYTVSGVLGNQTVTMVIPFNNTGPQNALVAHASGSGTMWVIPAGLKRDILAASSNNYFTQWPIGLEMECSSGAGLNCTASNDFGNSYQTDLFGRVVGGNNTSASSSINETFGKNYMMDVMEGGTLGEVYVNLNSNSVENGESIYSIMGNCINVNSSLFSGGYVGGGSLPGCAASVGLTPPTSGSPFLFIAPQSNAPMGGQNISNSTIYGAWTWSSGLGDTNCLGINKATWYVFGISNNSCSTVSTYGLGWDTNTNSFDWLFQNSAPMSRFISNALGYTGYVGAAGGFAYEGYPPGIMLYNSEGIASATNSSRMFSMGTSVPTGTWHLKGDMQCNTSVAPGGNDCWSDTSSFSTTLGGTVTKGSTTSVTVAACPATALPAGTPIDDVTAAPPVLLGTLSSCTATTLTFQAAASNNGTNGDTINFMQWYPSSPLSLDTGGITYRIGVATAIGSLPTCNAALAGARATVNNGVASPTYQGAVSTTGAVTQPVYCNGSGWVYD